MQKAKVVRAIDHNSFIQLLCTNGLELISVYFVPKSYGLLCKAIEKVGLKLEGLEILFDKQRVHVLALGNIRSLSHHLARTKTFPLVN